MGWFRKKSDPISERAQALNQQIARLEAQIRELSEQQAAARQEPPTPPPAPAPPAPPPSAPAPAREAAREPGPAPSPEPFAEAEHAPRLRSTAFPQGRAAPEKVRESGLEDLGGNPFKSRGRPKPERDLGVGDFTGLWKRFKRQFRGPATSNPKLVSYLAAGSIQGLRPLRYERRVARNRTILLLVCFVLILWGILAILIR
jgi:hypothetical protein